jgi:hypothetical protein
MYRRSLFWVRWLLLARHQPGHEQRTLDRGLVHDHGKDDSRAVRGQIV